MGLLSRLFKPKLCICGHSKMEHMHYSKNTSCSHADFSHDHLGTIVSRCKCPAWRPQ